uniref:DNA-directed DNA polymerase n=1 Tax=Macrostomum lignano TaxID=282301 RepID=A0A1I8J2D7_9PLAT
MRIFIADLAQFQPPPQPDTVEGDGFNAHLGGAKALPKFKAKGYEYVVFFADTIDIRSTFEKIISALCADLHANDFVSAKMTADDMLLAINVPPVRRSRFTAELIFKHINKVLQSDSSVLGKNFKLFLLKAWVPRGGCGSLDVKEKHIQARHAMGYNYVVIANRDKRCLIRALVVAKAYADLQAKAITKNTWQTIKADSPLQKKLTGELQIAAKLYSAGPFGVDVLPQLLAVLNAQWPGRDFGVRVYTAEEGNTCVYALPDSTVLNVHLIGEHLNTVCKVPPFFGARRHCDSCQQPYDCISALSTSVPTSCKVPGSNCKSLCDFKRIADCGLKCYNQQCFDNHRRKNRAGRSRCSSIRVCANCGYLEELKVGQKEPDHKCGHVKFPLCKQYDEAGSHLCFVKAPKVKASNMPYVFYDTVTYTDEEKQHHVHLVTAVTCCETCSGRAFPRETCRLCNGLHSTANCLTGRDLGEEFSNCVSHSNCACQMADFVAGGPASLNAFFAWLSTTFRGGAIVAAQNASGYDSFLLLGALLNGLAKKRPQVLFQGSRLMSMTRSDDLRNTLLHGGSLQLPQFQFRCDKASCTIHTISMDKTFQRVLTKRVPAAASVQTFRLDALKGLVHTDRMNGTRRLVAPELKLRQLQRAADLAPDTGRILDNLSTVMLISRLPWNSTWGRFLARPLSRAPSNRGQSDNWLCYAGHCRGGKSRAETPGRNRSRNTFSTVWPGRAYTHVLPSSALYTRTPKSQPGDWAFRTASSWGSMSTPKGSACPTFDTDRELIEIRRFYTDKNGNYKHGFPGVFLTRIEWEHLKRAWPIIESLHVLDSRHKRFQLGESGRKILEVKNSQIWLHRINPAGCDEGERWKYSIKFTPELWTALMDADVDSLFASQSPPPPPPPKTASEPSSRFNSCSSSNDGDGNGNRRRSAGTPPPIELQPQVKKLSTTDGGSGSGSSYKWWHSYHPDSTELESWAAGLTDEQLFKTPAHQIGPHEPAFAAWAAVIKEQNKRIKLIYSSDKAKLPPMRVESSNRSRSSVDEPAEQLVAVAVAVRCGKTPSILWCGVGGGRVGRNPPHRYIARPVLTLAYDSNSSSGSSSSSSTNSSISGDSSSSIDDDFQGWCGGGYCGNECCQPVATAAAAATIEGNSSSSSLKQMKKKSSRLGINLAPRMGLHSAVAASGEAAAVADEAAYQEFLRQWRREPDLDMNSENPAVSAHYVVTVQSKDPYPIGHPVQHPTPQTFNSYALASYFGIAKVTVLPPSDLHIPLLPNRVQKKLFFGLCRTCMEQQCSGCDHSDQKRALTGTWATPELQKAFQLGYRLQAVHALAYWTEKRTGLFGDYVNAFLKMKAESSGSPGMSDEDKAAYIADFYAKEGHAGQGRAQPRTSLCSENLFEFRDDLTSTEIVSSYEDWLARLTDPNLKVKACEPIGSEFMLLEYRHRYFNQRPF